MKKLLSFVLALVFVLSLVSCSQTLDIPEETEETKTETVVKTEEKKTTEKQTEEKKTEEKTEEKKTLGPVAPLPKVTLPAMIFTDQTYTEHLASMKNKVDEFSKEKIETGKILFYGHSHFTRWNNNKKANYCTVLMKDMITTPKGNKPVINHGFGSSTLYDLCYFYEKAVRPWEPRAIVINTYVNDRAGFSTAQQMVLLDWLLNQISTDFPECQVFVDDFPPISKMNDWSKTSIDARFELNEEAKKIIDKYPNAVEIEISKYPGFYKDAASVGTYQNIREELFLEDKTHHTPLGYEVCAEFYKEALKDILAEYDK